MKSTLALNPSHFKFRVTISSTSCRPADFTGNRFPRNAAPRLRLPIRDFVGAATRIRRLFRVDFSEQPRGSGGRSTVGRTRTARKAGPQSRPAKPARKAGPQSRPTKPARKAGPQARRRASADFACE